MYRTGHSQIKEKPWEFSHHHAGAYKQNSVRGDMPRGAGRTPQPASMHDCKQVCGHNQDKVHANVPN